LRRGREVAAFNRNQVSLGTYPDQAATADTIGGSP
jgi:hypothetical protein